MKIIGLTGGIASGKSTVAHLLEKLGAKVVDADQLAREAVEPGAPALDAINKALGPQYINTDGTLNRKALGNKVFGDIESLKKLESIMHPAISELAKRRLDELRSAGSPTVFYMAPLLIERGIHNDMDEVWVVYVDERTQLLRLVVRDGFSEEEARQRLRAQMPIEEKKLYGKVIIDNNGTIEETARQVEKAYKALAGG